MRSPLRDSVQSTLEDRIRKGLYSAGRRLPAERTLSEELGVSRAVVRAAIAALEANGLLVRSAGCRPLVRAVQNRIAPSGTSSRHTFALWLMHRPTDGEAPALLYGIQHALDPDTQRLVVANAMGDSWTAVVQSEAQFLDRMTEDRDIAGIMLWYIGGDTNLPALLRIREAGIPMVFLDRQPPKGLEADHVGVDNRSSAEQAVRHLISRGHLRIAHVTNYDCASTVDDRLAGYRLALEDSGIPFDPRLVVQARIPGEGTSEECLAVVERLRERGATAVFALNDRMAFELMEAMASRKIDVPRDMAVVGFDGIERWMPGQPFLTTCNQPFQRLAAHAVDLLVRRIAQGADAPYRHVLLEAPLVVYGSTGLGDDPNGHA